MSTESAAPELSPFEVECLRVLAGAGSDLDFEGFIAELQHLIPFPVPHPRWVAYHLERLGLVDTHWDVTDAGRAALLALGVTW